MPQSLESSLALTCPAEELGPMGHPFNLPLAEDALVDLSHKNFSPETVKKIK